MSYKLNLKNPLRKVELDVRRQRQRTDVATPPRPRWVQPKNRPAYIGAPKDWRTSKYILEGSGLEVNPDCNIPKEKQSLVDWGQQ